MAEARSVIINECVFSLILWYAVDMDGGGSILQCNVSPHSAHLPFRHRSLCLCLMTL